MTTAIAIISTLAAVMLFCCRHRLTLERDQARREALQRKAMLSAMAERFIGYIYEIERLKKERDATRGDADERREWQTIPRTSRG